jgi:hypothetical protein
MNETLRPIDVPVALYLALRPHATYSTLAHELQISTSTAHESVERLMFAGLMRRVSGSNKTVSAAALEEFLLHGVRYAFPAQKERQKRGVPTAHAAPILSREFDSLLDPVVWPSTHGKVVGAALKPLVPAAPELAERYPALYELLALVDAIRVGTARDRDVAGRLLSKRLDVVGA